MKQAQEITNAINYARIYKKVYLVCKLLGLKGQNPTKCYYNLNEESYLKQKFLFQQVDKPRRKVVKSWKEFMKQPKEQKVRTIYDFE